MTGDACAAGTGNPTIDVGDTMAGDAYGSGTGNATRAPCFL